MRNHGRLFILAFPLAWLGAQTATSDPGGVLSHLTVARFMGSGIESIQAMTSDAAGNVYVAGTTSSPDLPVKNAMQPSIGDIPFMRSYDRGVTWETVPLPPVPSYLWGPITPHPGDPNTLFLGAGDGIYKTVDAGLTWRRVFSGPTEVSSSGCCAFGIKIDPANPRKAYTTVYARVDEIVRSVFLVSSDGGESWQRRDFSAAWNGSPPGGLWVDPSGSGTIGFGFWLSRDGGLTWSSMTKPPTRYAPSINSLDPWHPGWIFASKTVGALGELYLSQDWGATWAPRPGPLTDYDSTEQNVGGLVFDPDFPNTLYVAAGSGLAMSSDAGVSWHAPAAKVYLDSDKQPVVLSRQCAGGALLVLSGGRVVSSYDSGANWQPGQLSQVYSLIAAPGCTVYAQRSRTSDAFVTKLGPGGSEVLWSTFLGGSDLDSSASITLDEHGNVYVAGNTSSADFPVTTPRAGPSGQQDAFVVKFDPEGRLVYSTVFGGESLEEAMGLAVNAAGEAHLVGRTTSKSFPATPGAFETQAGASDGFAVKLQSDGAIAYASYLPGMAPPGSVWRGHYPPRLVSVAVEASGSILIGANVWMANVLPGTIFRMSSDGSSLTKASRLPGLVYAMETDRQGDVYVAGQITMGSKSRSCFQGWRISDLLPGDIFVTKLQSESLQEVYSARLYGECQSWPGTLKVGPTGEVTIGVWALHDFPLRNPVMMVRSCGVRGIAAVSRLSADGSTVLFSSYLDACWQSPTVALGPEGSLYAGITQNSPSGHAIVLQLPVAQAAGMWVERAVNAFSGVLGPVGPNMLLTITGQNLASEFIDLGLNYALPPPTQLGGVQVLFNDIPAEIFQVAPDHVICVPPAGVQNQEQASVQVVSGPQKSTPFVLPSTFATLGLLTRAFPGLPPAGVVDGYIFNADGSQNDAQHPAAPGSTVTLFATGLSGPRDIALYWNAPASQPDPTGLNNQRIYPLYGQAYHAPGLMDALYAVDFRIPDAPGQGVYLVPVPGVLTRAIIGLGNSGLGVYVK